MTPEQAIAQLQTLQQSANEAAMKGELRIAAIIADEAKIAAPGSLSSQIYISSDSGNTVIIGGPDISAYVEFGTGNFAKEYVESLPEEWKEEAMKFFVNGKGHGAPHPFFFPAVFRNQDKILEAVNEELQKLF